MSSRARAEALDAADPLAAFRDEFLIPDDGVVYLDGNSLGRPPRATLEALAAVVRGDWATGLIGSWDHWVDLPFQVGDALAPLIGAAPGEVLVHDSVTVNLYRLVHAALGLRPGARAIAVDPGDFPSDRYVVASIAESHGLDVRAGFDDLDGVGVVVRSMVDYRTAEIVDVAREAARAQAAGAVVVWDLSHAAGVLDLDAHALGMDLAVGCTYKFLNGGPGAPAFSYVRGDLIERIDQPIHGWFGTRDQFTMGPAFEARPDIGRLQAGTPGILGLTAARCGIELTARAGIAAVREKATALTQYALERCEALGLASPTPREPQRRGGHVSIRHPRAAWIVRTAAAEHGVVADFREPDLVRLGCSPLTTRYVDVHDGVEVVAALARGRVTSGA